MESYHFPHFALYSSSMLEKWFVREKYGQAKYIESKNLLQVYIFTAQPAIKKWPKLNPNDFSSFNPTRILIAYARPHADRNAFQLTIYSVSAAICANAFPGN